MCHGYAMRFAAMLRAQFPLIWRTKDLRSELAKCVVGIIVSMGCETKFLKFSLFELSSVNSEFSSHIPDFYLFLTHF